MKAYSQIEDYLSGKLSPADRLTFEQTLKEDLELQKLVNHYQEVETVEKGILELYLLDEVKNITSQPNSPNKRQNKKYYLIFGLLLVALIFALFYFLESSPKTEKEELLFAYYQRPVHDSNERSIQQDSKIDFQAAKDLFELNEFSKSAEILKTIGKNNTDLNTLQAINYWLGHAYFKLEQYAEAEKAFSNSVHANKDCLIFLSQALQEKISVDQVKIYCSSQ